MSTRSVRLPLLRARPLLHRAPAGGHAACSPCRPWRAFGLLPGMCTHPLDPSLTLRFMALPHLHCGSPAPRRAGRRHAGGPCAGQQPGSGHRGVAAACISSSARSSSGAATAAAACRRRRCHGGVTRPERALPLAGAQPLLLPVLANFHLSSQTPYSTSLHIRVLLSLNTLNTSARCICQAGQVTEGRRQLCRTSMLQFAMKIKAPRMRRRPGCLGPGAVQRGGGVNHALHLVDGGDREAAGRQAGRVGMQRRLEGAAGEGGRCLPTAALQCAPHSASPVAPTARRRCSPADLGVLMDGRLVLGQVDWGTQEGGLEGG